MKSKNQLISTLKLEPLTAEGGYYRRIFESTLTDSAARRYAASIYYLLEADDFSCFHRLDCDELWHFYAGDTLMIYQIKPDGSLVQIRLGNPLADVQAAPFAFIEKNTWFAVEIVQQSGVALAGCTTIPEFQFEKFEAANRELLCAEFPQHQALITRLTR